MELGKRVSNRFSQISTHKANNLTYSDIIRVNKANFDVIISDRIWEIFRTASKTHPIHQMRVVFKPNSITVHSAINQSNNPYNELVLQYNLTIDEESKDWMMWSKKVNDIIVNSRIFNDERLNSELTDSGASRFYGFSFKPLGKLLITSFNTSNCQRIAEYKYSSRRTHRGFSKKDLGYMMIVYPKPHLAHAALFESFKKGLYISPKSNADWVHYTFEEGAFYTSESGESNMERVVGLTRIADPLRNQAKISSHVLRGFYGSIPSKFKSLPYMFFCISFCIDYDGLLVANLDVTNSLEDAKSLRDVIGEMFCDENIIGQIYQECDKEFTFVDENGKKEKLKYPETLKFSMSMSVPVEELKKDVKTLPFIVNQDGEIEYLYDKTEHELVGVEEASGCGAEPDHMILTDASTQSSNIPNLPLAIKCVMGCKGRTTKTIQYYDWLDKCNINLLAPDMCTWFHPYIGKKDLIDMQAEIDLQLLECAKVYDPFVDEELLEVPQTIPTWTDVTDGQDDEMGVMCREMRMSERVERYLTRTCNKEYDRRNLVLLDEIERFTDEFKGTSTEMLVGICSIARKIPTLSTKPLNTGRFYTREADLSKFKKAGVKSSDGYVEIDNLDIGVPPPPQVKGKKSLMIEEVKEEVKVDASQLYREGMKEINESVKDEYKAVLTLPINLQDKYYDGLREFETKDAMLDDFRKRQEQVAEKGEGSTLLDIVPNKIILETVNPLGIEYSTRVVKYDDDSSSGGCVRLESLVERLCDVDEVDDEDTDE